MRKIWSDFGIPHLDSRSARKISGGEAQRVALARAMATRARGSLPGRTFCLSRPSEPGVPDRRPGDEFCGRPVPTTVFATHDRMEALRLSDRIAVMNGGRILQIGPPAEVMNQPLDEFVASFVGVETILTGRSSKGSGQLHSFHHGVRGRGGGESGNRGVRWSSASARKM